MKPEFIVYTPRTMNDENMEIKKQPTQNIPTTALGIILLIALGGLVLIWALCLNFISKEQDRIQIFLAVSVNFLILMAMLVQAYITQRQWRAMNTGLVKTQELIDQNERMIAEVGKQATHAEGQLTAMKDTLTEMQNQREIAKQQTDIALQQLRMTDRPWIKVDIEFTGPLTFDERNAVYVECGIRATNIGRSVALNTKIAAQIAVPFRYTQDEFSKKQSEVLKSLAYFSASHTVFPGQPYTSYARLSCGPKDVADGRKTSADMSANSIMIYLIGCVDYQICGDDTHHQTFFSYEIARSTPDRVPYLFPVGEEVSVNELALRRPQVDGAEYAN